MIDYRQIESRAVELLLTLEKSPVPIDVPFTKKMLDQEQARYVQIRVELARQNGNYHPPELNYSGYEDYVEDNVTPYHLKRAYMCGYMLNRLLAQAELNRINGKSITDEVFIRYRFMELAHRLMPSGDIRHAFWPRRFHKCVRALPGRKLVCVGFESLEMYVMGVLSGDPVLLDDCQNDMVATTEFLFGDIVDPNYRRLMRCLFVVLLSGGESDLTYSLFCNMTDEDEKPRISREAFQEIQNKFDQRYLMTVGFQEQLRSTAVFGTITGRTLRYPQTMGVVSTTASDISKHTLTNVVQDSRLAKFDFQPHLLSLDTLVCSVPDTVDLDDMEMIIRDDLHYPDMPGIPIVYTSGQTWWDCTQQFREQSVERFNAQRSGLHDKSQHDLSGTVR